MTHTGNKTDPHDGHSWLFLSISLLLCIGVALTIAYRNLPSPPKSVNSNEQEFSAQRTSACLRGLLGDAEAHPVGTLASMGARERIATTLVKLGYNAEINSGFVCGRSGNCAEIHNVVARLSGQDDSSILLSAHYDSVPVSPGVSDDGEGVATILEIARILKQGPALRNSFIFLIDDGEEAGLLGAQLFVSQNPWAKTVRAAINLEARGTSGPSLMFETGSANKWAVELYSRAVSRPHTNSLYYMIYKMLPNDTDFSIFKEAGYQGLGLAYIGDANHYHTRLDNFANVNLASIQEQGEDALALAVQLANADLEHIPAGKSVFFDFLSFRTIHWPSAWTLPMAVAAFAFLGFGVTISLAKHRLQWSQLLWSFGAWPVMILLSALFGATFGFALHSTGALSTSWPAHPAPFLVASGALGFLIVNIVAIVIGPKMEFSGSWLGVWSWWTIAALVLAAFAPGASYVFLVPAMIATVLIFLTAFLGDRLPFFQEIASLAAMLSAVILGLSAIWPLYDAVGEGYLSANVILTAVIFSPLVPFMSAIRGRSRWALTWFSGATVVVASAIAVFVPTYSPRSPQRVNLIYADDADSGQQKWLAFADSKALPSEIAAAGKFTTNRTSPFPWAQKSAFLAQGERLQFESPALILLSSSTENGKTVYHLLLRPASVSSAVMLLFPASSRVESLTINGQAGHPMKQRSAETNEEWFAYNCLSLPREGATVQLVAPADEMLEVYLLEQRFGLPAESRNLLAAEGPYVTPYQGGNLTLVMRHIQLSHDTATTAQQIQ